MSLFNRTNFFRCFHAIEEPTEYECYVFVRELIANQLDFHPDDDPADIIYYNRGRDKDNRVFTDYEASLLNDIIPRMFLAAEKSYLFEDLYDVFLKISPANPEEPPFAECIKVGLEEMEEGEYFIGYTKGRTWNGWAVPLFDANTIEEVLKILVYPAEDGGYKIDRDVEGCPIHLVVPDWDWDVEIYKTRITNHEGKVITVFDLNDLGLCFSNLGSLTFNQ